MPSFSLKKQTSKNVVGTTFKDIFRKCLEMEKNQLKCEDYVISFQIPAGDDDQQIQYRWHYVTIVQFLFTAPIF